MKRTFALLTAALAALSALTLGCLSTKHEIHITLDIRHISSSVENEVAASKGTREIRPPLDLGDVQMTPVLTRAMNNRARRMAEVRQYRAEGLVGENNMGRLELRADKAGRSDEEKLKFRLTVEEENADRDIIYQEIARQSGDTSPAALFEIRRRWAATLRDALAPGEWFQAPSEAAHYDAFLVGRLGNLIAAASVPAKGAWLQVPASYAPAQDVPTPQQPQKP